MQFAEQRISIIKREAGNSILYECDSKAEWLNLGVDHLEIQANSLKNCSRAEVVTILPSVSHVQYKTFELLPRLEYIKVDPENCHYCDIKGVLFDKSMETLLFCPPCSGFEEYTVPDGVKTIAQGAFVGNKALKKINIPDSVETIGERAFLGCTNLEAPILPDSLTAIGPSAFEGCQKFEHITIPNGVWQICAKTFRRCENLKSAVLPETVNLIGNYAFEHCSHLEYMKLPERVGYLAEKAFAGSPLDSIIKYSPACGLPIMFGIMKAPDQKDP